MALSPENEELANALSLLIIASDQGMTPEQLRAGLQESGVPHESIESWVKLAKIFHEEDYAEAPIVANPRFRKGTAMKPAKWSDCLWKPTP